MLNKYSLLILLLLAGQNVFAQGGCTANEHFNDFDFWVGQWDVTNNANGDVAGSNTITKELNNCLIVESWSGAGGSIGKSLNYFNPLSEDWRQLWVAPGYVIDISGGLENGSMVLTGTIAYFNDKVYDFRGSWTPAEDGSVRQFFEQYDPENENWSPWFDGRYVKAQN